MSKSHVSLPSEAPTHSLMGVSFQIVTPGAATGGTMHALVATFPPGLGMPPYHHDGVDELYHVLEGTLTLMVEGREFQAPAGTTMFLKGGTVHAVRNDGDVPAKLYEITQPAWPVEDFIADVQALLSSGEAPTPEAMLAIYTRYDLVPAGP